MKIFSQEDKDVYQKSWEKNGLSILQSWQWGEFKNRPLGVIRVGLGNFVATIFIKQIPGAGWKFGYIPHGRPIEMFTEPMSKKLTEIMEKYSLSHILIDPYVLRNEVETAPNGFSFSNQPTIQIQYTIVTELLDSDEEMMNRMRKKHRQYIRKSQRGGLVFDTDDSLAGVERLATVLNNQHTTKNFLAYPPEYYTKLWSKFEGTGKVHVHIVKVGEEDVGAYLVIDGVDRTYQFFGGTTAKGRDLYGAYLLTWKSMLASRDRGFKLYDQWGVAPYDEDGKLDSSDEKYGISVFKEGFTGEKFTYANQLVVVNNQSRYTIYSNLIKLHRSYIKFRKTIK